MWLSVLCVKSANATNFRMNATRISRFPPPIQTHLDPKSSRSSIPVPLKSKNVTFMTSLIAFKAFHVGLGRPHFCPQLDTDLHEHGAEMNNNRGKKRHKQKSMRHIDASLQRNAL